MALQSNDINDLNRKRIIESSDVPGQPGVVVLNPDGTAVGAPVGGATSANQTNGTQKTQIVDGSGNVIGSTSNALDVNIKSGSSSETQYTEGDTDASITGNAIMWEDTSDTLRPVSASKPLPVNIVSSSASGTEYTEGDVDATLTGTIAMAEGPSNTATPLQVDASKHLQIDIAAASTDITVQDGGGSLTVDNNGTFATQAAQSGTWNITNVSGTVSLPTGASTLAEQQSQTTHLSTIAGDTTSIQTAVELLDDTVATDGSATPTKGILMAGQDGTNAQTISTNSSGHINIADGGNTITVDGTVGVSGSVTVTEGGGSLTVDNNGTFVVQENGAALTALQLIDDAVATTALAIPTKGIAISGTDGTNARVIKTDTSGELQVDVLTMPTTTVTATNLSTNIAQMNGVTVTMGNGVSGTGVQRVTLASDSTGQVTLAAGTNGIGKLTANSGVDIGDVDVTSVIPGTGATNLGKAEDAGHTTGDTGVMALGVRSASPTDRSAGPTDGDYEPFALNEVGAIWTTLTPSANGGLTIFRSIDLDESEEEIKATAGNIYAYYFANTSSSARYLKLYNATAANVTVGTTTPVVTLYLPATSAGHVGLPYPIAFSTAITAAATTGVADNDTGAPGANEVIFNAFYK